MTATRKPVVQRADGYRLVYAPDHPDAHVRGYVYEHRLVAEQKIGRRLADDEHVHHVNEDPSDNRAENIEVLTIREHRRRHGNTTLTDEEIAELIRQGYTYARLRSEYGVATRRAMYARRRAGLPGPPRYDHDEIRRLIAQGLRGVEIARLTGASQQSVSNIRHGRQ